MVATMRDSTTRKRKQGSATARRSPDDTSGELMWWNATSQALPRGIRV